MKVDVFERDKAVAQSGSYTSGAINVRNTKGYFSLLIETSGSGVIDLGFKVCDDADGTFVAPSSGSSIATGHAAGSDVYTFTVPVCEQLKITVDEDGTGTATLVRCVLMYR